VFFNAWSSVPTSGTLVWQFGDGARGAGLTPTHRYARAGTYTVSLTVTSEAGQSATSSRAIYVTAPGPPLDAIEQCGQMPDRLALVACIHALVNPPRTVAGAFEVAKRVAWVLRGEGAGLLIKNGGDNIVSWRGYSFSASRICFPDGHIYKVLADVPATNAPSWQDDDFVAPSLYVPAIDPRLP
jgi:PKD repeat protein